MFKKFAIIAVAAVISSAAFMTASAPAAAQGISVQLGNGGGYRDGYRGRGYDRRPDYRRYDRGYHRGYDRRPRGRTIIVR